MTRGVFRIKLGGVRAQEGDEHGRPVTYIMKHKDKPRVEVIKEKIGKVLDLGKKREESESGLKAQCRKAKEALERLSLDGEGPYSDENGALDGLAEVIDGKNLFQTIEHVIDILRPADSAEREVEYPREYEYGGLKLAVDENLIDEMTGGLVTAGKILEQKKEREYEDEVSGVKYMMLNDSMEPMLLAVAVMRMLGIPAYPAIAQARLGENREQIQSTIIAVLDPESEDPLITFQLLRNHPVAEAVDIIGDEAMLGGTYAMKAANMGKKLSNDMVQRILETNEVIPEEEIMERLKEIGEMLCECAIRWEKSPMIANAIATIGQYIYNAAKNTEGIKAIRATEDESIIEDPNFALNAHNIGLIAAERYTRDILHYMNHKLAKEMAKEKETPDEEPN